jgi:hypothetical protein
MKAARQLLSQVSTRLSAQRVLMGGFARQLRWSAILRDASLLWFVLARPIPAMGTTI